MSSGDVISWYAYQDPKSGREYFHEPVSGKTSWVLPTSTPRGMVDCFTHLSTKNNSESSGNKSLRQNKPTGVSKPHYLMSAVGMTIVFILVFNTLFLLLLVKVLRENELQSHAFNVKRTDDTLIGPSIEVLPESTEVPLLSAIEKTDLDNETLCSTTDASSEAQEIHHLETAPAMEETEHDLRDLIDGFMNEGNSKHQVIGRKENFVVRERAEVLEYNNIPPMRCWIPFSYIVLRKCRQQVRAGFPMPLANAEYILLI